MFYPQLSALLAKYDVAFSHPDYARHSRSVTAMAEVEFRSFNESLAAALVCADVPVEAPAWQAALHVLYGAQVVSWGDTAGAVRHLRKALELLPTDI